MKAFRWYVNSFLGADSISLIAGELRCNIEKAAPRCGTEDDGASRPMRRTASSRTSSRMPSGTMERARSRDDLWSDTRMTTESAKLETRMSWSSSLAFCIPFSIPFSIPSCIPFSIPSCLPYSIQWSLNCSSKLQNIFPSLRRISSSRPNLKASLTILSRSSSPRPSKNRASSAFI